ncbi:hypothetical protein CC85DRAFT_141875 [Cutaneotrichosporon oleaginosum]|uniref:Uncharacterized protein n=1 Tax=Cutaneotrichosporon oleaginosum TaxID=879819 RepID=A0A0J0XI98_9TREE|nr:uncharacterized protein CC85DRAFT_141875 [Cutaneotrichosporon oleaginosum]KLT40737.1 hypothetical protein CC85DRAFT_141875 [Cutaneotrichosporon oleaginosum]TXT06807.1 hypothetical protein COLE_06138 [Cutaneotrichosporon oleaginosum]
MTVDDSTDANGVKAATFKGSRTMEVTESGTSSEANGSNTESHSSSHSFQNSGCDCSDHKCKCASVTRHLIKTFLPVLSEEREAELRGWTMNDETWSCVPYSDAPAITIVNSLHSFQSNEVCNEVLPVNAFMKVLNTLNHHVMALPSRFFSHLTYTTDLSHHGIGDDIARIVIPTHRFGAWIGVLIETHDQRACIFDPCATLTAEDLEEIKGRLSVFDVKEHYVIMPKRPIHIRYSVVAVCTGLEMLARAGWAPVAHRVLGKLSEIIGSGGDLSATLDGLTEEKMHADDHITKEEVKLATKLSRLTVDPASNAIASQFANRVAWSLATCELNAPMWKCGCIQKTNEATTQKDTSSDEGSSDKENAAPPQPDYTVEEPALKKRKE